MSWNLKKKVKDALAKESGAVRKEHGGRFTVCLVYPNTYSVGMANLGFQSVYTAINRMEGAVCERAFLPEKADLKEFERTGAELFSYESFTPLRQFDLIAFSIPFEDDYFNVPNILELSGIPARHEDRVGGPIVAAGGVAVSLNPEPMSDLIDFFIIGEAEGALEPIIERLSEYKGRTKSETLNGIDKIVWAYVPSFYEFEYDGIHVKAIKKAEGAKACVKAAKQKDLDSFPTPQSFIYTPDTEFRDTYCMEVERGCPRGCRFCAAGFLYLPPRMRKSGPMLGSIGEGLKRSGKVGLVGTAVSEYPEIKELLRRGIGEGGTITLSSLRLDELDPEYLSLLKEAGYRTITLAPEAGSGRMKRAINKDIPESEIIESIRLITEAGFRRMKLYFLIGLPDETDEDAEGIVELTKKIKGAFTKGGEINLSINPFTPKPCTPFQWHRFEDTDVTDRRLAIIKKGLSKEGVVISGMNSREAFSQAYISRADRRAGDFILKAARTGWKRAIKGSKKFIEESVYSGREKDEVLPWDLIDHGIKKAYFWKEYEKALSGKTTPPCDVGRCLRCGVC